MAYPLDNLVATPRHRHGRTNPFLHPLNDKRALHVGLPVSHQSTDLFGGRHWPFRRSAHSMRLVEPFYLGTRERYRH